MRNPPISSQLAHWLLASFLFLCSTALQAQDVLWEAYNDYRPVDGETHPNVSGYDLRITDDGGKLKNFETGADLSATVTVVVEGDGEPDDFGANSPVNPGSPADLVFAGKVVLGNEGLPGLRTSNNVKLILNFSGLDRTKRYNFRGTVSRGGNYNDRWSVFGISGTDAHVAAHVDGSDNQNLITKATFPAADLSSDQVAMNTGDNKAGSLVGWDNIEPGSDGTFAIEAQQYQGAAPFGDPAAAPYGYGFNAICLTEIESSGELRITENPTLSQIIPAGETATLGVEASSPQVITYQWQKAAPGTENFADIVGATDASYTTPALTVADHQSTYRVVLSSGGFDIISGIASIEVDAGIPKVERVEGSINFDSVYVTFSEPMKLALLANQDNYAIDGLTIRGAQARDSRTVRLITSPQSKAATLQLTVKNLEDLGGNTVDPNAIAEFKTYTFANESVGLEIWENIGGAVVADLRNNPRFPLEPDVDYSTTGIDSLLVFDDGPNNTYGGRFRAWLIPDETTSYQFFLRAGDEGEFRIAEGTQFGPFDDIDSEADIIASGNNPFSDDAATPRIDLEQGKKYAVEVIWKEANGSDRAQLAWRKAGDATPPEELLPIPSQYFCYFGSNSFDTDNDGLSDAYEVLNGLNPNSNDANGDADGDGLTNIQEHDLGTAANIADTDADGLDDNSESGTGIFVSATDTGSDPQIPDSDNDGIKDGIEVNSGTDPNKPDTDADGFSDSVELALNTDPKSAASKPNAILASSIGLWNDPTTWSDGQAPREGTNYVILNTITEEVSTDVGAFPGDSLTLLGPDMALRVNHDGSASANIVLQEATMKIRASNTLNGSLTLNGNILFDGQAHDFVLGSTLKGAPVLTIQSTDAAGPGQIELAGATDEFNGLIRIQGTSVIASGLGSLGSNSITLSNANLAFGYEYSSPTAVLIFEITAGDFNVVLGANVSLADIVGIDADGNAISIFEVAGPGPYTAAELSDVFQIEEVVTGEGTITLTGNTMDSDLDGLLDPWEMANFGNLNATPGEDPDRDGLINLAEQVGKTDPNIVNAPDTPVDPDPPVATDRPVIGRVTKDATSVGLSFPAGTTFDVEYSEDLSTWSVIATEITGDYSDASTDRVGKASGYYRGVTK